MKKMDIPKEDRREFIEDCYSCLGRFAGYPTILEEKTKDIYGIFPLITENAKSALEKSLDDRSSKIMVDMQEDYSF